MEYIVDISYTGTFPVGHFIKFTEKKNGITAKPGYITWQEHRSEILLSTQNLQ